MLIDMSDPLWPRVSAAFNANPDLTNTGLTSDQVAQNAIMGFIKATVRGYEANQLLRPAKAVVDAAVAKVEADFDGQFAKTGK